MAKKMSQSKSRIKRYFKSVVVLIVIIALAYWGYYSYTNPTASVTTTISTATPSATNTVVPLLKWTDFNLTTSNGCTFPNETTGQTELLFILTVTNRFNVSVHYMNESATVSLISPNNGNGISVVPFTVSLRSSDYTNRLVLLLTTPIGNIPNGTFDLSISLTAYAKEVNGPIDLLDQIPLTQAISACST